MDANERLRQLLKERGRTEYKLSKECGLAQSTIGNIFRRNTVPSISTIETICKGFGITLSQFFAETDMVELTPDTKELFDHWVCVAPDRDKPPDKRRFPRHFTLSKFAIRQYSCTLSSAPDRKIARFRVRGSSGVNKIFS